MAKAKTKCANLVELVSEYDDKFIESITLDGVSSMKDLKELYNKLDKANRVVTLYYETMYNDYITMINSDSLNVELDINTIKKFKLLASKIQKAYSYITYVMTFENPFRISK